jgi:hypothetical protein
MVVWMAAKGARFRKQKLAAKNMTPEQLMAYWLERHRQAGDSAQYVVISGLGRVTDSRAQDIIERLVYGPCWVKDFKEWINMPREEMEIHLLTPAMWEFSQHMRNVVLKGVFSINDQLAARTGIDYAYQTNGEERKEWLNIRRGRDVFIKGLGSFPLRGIIWRNLFQRQNPTIWTVRATGYFKKYVPRHQDRDGRYHYIHRFLRYHTPFAVLHLAQLLQNETYRNRIDEIVRLLNHRSRIGQLEECLDMSLTQLLRLAHERDEAANYDDDPNYQPFAAETQYDVGQYPAISTPVGILAPIRSGAELDQVAQALANCSKGYHSSIVNKESVLVVLRDGEKPVALGELDPEDLAWRQYSGIKNQKLNSKQVLAFEQYRGNLVNETISSS